MLGGHLHNLAESKHEACASRLLTLCQQPSRVLEPVALNSCWHRHAWSKRKLHASVCHKVCLLQENLSLEDPCGCLVAWARCSLLVSNASTQVCRSKFPYTDKRTAEGRGAPAVTCSESFIRASVGTRLTEPQAEARRMTCATTKSSAGSSRTRGVTSSFERIFTVAKIALWSALLPWNSTNQHQAKPQGRPC